MFQLYLMYLFLLKPVVHGMDEGTHLSTCLGYAACVVAFVACENADEFSVLYFILLKTAMHRHE